VWFATGPVAAATSELWPSTCHHAHLCGCPGWQAVPSRVGRHPYCYGTPPAIVLHLSARGARETRAVSPGCEACPARPGASRCTGWGSPYTSGSMGSQSPLYVIARHLSIAFMTALSCTKSQCPWQLDSMSLVCAASTTGACLVLQAHTAALLLPSLSSPPCHSFLGDGLHPDTGLGARHLPHPV